MVLFNLPELYFERREVIPSGLRNVERSRIAAFLTVRNLVGLFWTS